MLATRYIPRAVKRNLERFSEEFMFQLSAEEWSNLKSQNVTSHTGFVRFQPRSARGFFYTYYPNFQ
ncbi:MAG: ORF6N domain-containing protein [Deltaproteobacteria bacterium]|nr:ORF6N domain-containing protein [Deltaproteobacteria bacterium]